MSEYESGTWHVFNPLHENVSGMTLTRREYGSTCHDLESNSDRCQQLFQGVPQVAHYWGDITRYPK